MRKGMRAKTIQWNYYLQERWRKSVVTDAELPLGFHARVYRPGGVCINFYWEIFSSDGDILRSGEAPTAYRAKCNCQSAWEDELRSAFEESEGCDFCLHMHVVKKTTDSEETALQVIDGNQMAVSSVAFDDPSVFHETFKINYCPLCNKKLKEKTNEVRQNKD